MLLTELRRGVAPLLALAVATLVWLSLFGLDQRFPGPWLALAQDVHTAPVASLVFAAAVWQASREHRRGMGDQVGSTARAAWRRRGLTWASVVLGGVLGVLLPFSAGVVLLVTHEAYAAPGWWWLLVTTVSGIGLDAALGVLVGVVFRSPLVAVVLGVTVYVVASDGRGPLRWWPPSEGSWAPKGGAQALIVLTLAVTVTALIALASRHRAAYLAVPAALVCLVVVDSPISFWRFDPRGDELVCQDTVCTSRSLIHQLDTVFAIAKPLLDKVSGIPGAPTTANHEDAGANLWVTSTFIDWHGRQIYDADNRGYRRNLVQPVISTRCTSHDELSQVAAAWWTGDAASPQEQAAVERLRRLTPEAQRRWFGDYLSAARSCDTAALAALR